MDLVGFKIVSRLFVVDGRHWKSAWTGADAGVAIEGFTGGALAKTEAGDVAG